MFAISRLSCIGSMYTTVQQSLTYTLIISLLTAAHKYLTTSVSLICNSEYCQTLLYWIKYFGFTLLLHFINLYITVQHLLSYTLIISLLTGAHFVTYLTTSVSLSSNSEYCQTLLFLYWIKYFGFTLLLHFINLYTAAIFTVLYTVTIYTVYCPINTFYSLFFWFSTIMAQLHMNLVTTSVMNGLKFLMPWTITQFDESFTVLEFFNETVKPRLDIECLLLSALVGQERHTLVLVDINLPLSALVPEYGRYLQYKVQSTDDGVVTATDTDESFSLSVPEPVRERNRKDVLYNRIISFFNSSSVGWLQDEITLANKLLVTLRDIFWHIDGHFHVFDRVKKPIPSIFNIFTGFNIPEQSKHRKRRTGNICADQLRGFALDLSQLLLECYWERETWKDLKPHFVDLFSSLSCYSEYLIDKNKRSKENHKSPTPVRELSDHFSTQVLEESESVPSSLSAIDKLVSSQSVYAHTSIDHLLPSESLKKHRLINLLTESGLSCRAMLLMYAPGGSIANLHFMWPLPLDISDESILHQRSQSTIEKIKLLLPVFHTRAMKRAMFDKFGRISKNVKPFQLRYFYKELTGDSSASSTTDEDVIDKRIKEIVEMEDYDIIDDLRKHNGIRSTRYDVFWEHCNDFLNEDIGYVVDERRHGQITHLARAISIRDFIDQVKALCPEGTPIPCEEWVRLQFWPKTPSAKASLQHTGRFTMKFMIQQRQWRQNHPDSHYAAACFRYKREYALQIRSECSFICLDDKHKIKIGEPGYPVASALRGKKVSVRSDETLAVGDHNFTKFSVIPSVIFSIDIPDEISESWYKGAVFVGVKDLIYEPSSPFRHMTELYKVLQSQSFSKPVLFIYSDGGPDHRLTYINVQLSLICLFLKYNLDYLCAGRTAPHHSWRNPVERIMSVLNLGLQCVGLARSEMSSEFETVIRKCSNLSDLRQQLTSCKEELSDSLSHVKIRLHSLFSRLQLHGKAFEIYHSATNEELSEFWSALIALDSTLMEGGTYRKDNISQHVKVAEFIEHCCQRSHYTFDILKCGKLTCSLCKPPRLPLSSFKELKHIPHPMPMEDGHYLPFLEAFNSIMSEEHRPSYVAKTKVPKKQKHSLPFRELNLPEAFSEVEIRDHECNDPIEVLYYSAKYSPICIYCAKDEGYEKDNEYPKCENCQDKPTLYIKNKK
uniref:Uncharacterized protein n=1 Tax=Amphimedon queenslandica TaxID=400682 RepID=A0A1X7TME8_AMPQE